MTSTIQKPLSLQLQFRFKDSDQLKCLLANPTNSRRVSKPNQTAKQARRRYNKPNSKYISGRQQQNCKD